MISPEDQYIALCILASIAVPLVAVAFGMFICQLPDLWRAARNPRHQAQSLVFALSIAAAVLVAVMMRGRR